MFESMSQFYAFYFPMLAAIILGIIFEKTLVKIEHYILSRIRAKIQRRRNK